MPYADNHGVRIYYELEGQGPPLVLAHGGTGSLDAWRQFGYADALRGEFRLILFDARGHGRSDRPHEASMSIMADDVVAVLDSVGVDRAAYWGYSMGSAIGLDLAVRHASRFNGFILGGISPYRWPDAVVGPLIAARDSFRLRLTDPEAYLKLTEGFFGRPLTTEERRESLARDAEADIAILSALIDRPPLTDDDLAGIAVPCLLYCGDRDPFYSGARECAAHMPQARLVSLPGLDHAGGPNLRDLVLPHVREFLAEVTKAQEASMSTEANKAVIHKLINGLNKGDLTPLDECLADSYANYRIDGKVMDKAGYKRFCAAIVVGASDTRTTIGDLLAEGDRAAFNMTITWTDTKGFMGRPPTGKRISMSEAYFVRFEGGQIVEMRNFQAQPRFE